ncbi:MAG: hypothetical protein M3Y67_04940, partial [Pseudomonadota bacterium]|nr:hypothetical protein [Pseudomonadota bacterium]
MPMIAMPGEQHCRLAVVAGCGGIVVAPEMQCTEVLADPARRRQVAERTQLALRRLRTFRRFGMPAQHRQRHDLRHLCLRRRVGEAGLAKAPSGLIETHRCLCDP